MSVVRVQYRSSGEFHKEWVKQYGEVEKSVADKVAELVKQFVFKFRVG